MPKYCLSTALIILMTVCSCLPFYGAYAEGTFTYTRTNIVIMRSAVGTDAPPPLPWQADSVEADNPGIIFDVEVRDGETFYSQKGWYNLSGPSEKSAVMLFFNNPGIAPIINSAQYAPLDILMINNEGIITQIVPNLMMAALEGDILPDRPIRAFLFLKGGTCELMNIQPGDRVLYKRFKQPPTVLSAPAPTPARTYQPVPTQQPVMPQKQPQSLQPMLPTNSNNVSNTAETPGQVKIIDNSPAPKRRRPNNSSLMIPVN